MNFIFHFFIVIITFISIKKKKRDVTVTVDANESMNEFNIIQSYKIFFCEICKVYDCQIHLANLDNVKFYNPQTSV